VAASKSVVGIYSQWNSVEHVVGVLRDAGFDATDISVLVPENLGPKELQTVKQSKAPEGAAAGASTGAVIGGAIGWLVGIGALAIPALGPFIAAGPMVAALAGLGAGGAVGGFAGALIGLGIPEYEAKLYEGRLKNGGMLLSVHCETPKQIDDARRLMEQTGAEDISTTSDTRKASSGA
jgi:hypothetical protein